MQRVHIASGLALLVGGILLTRVLGITGPPKATPVARPSYTEEPAGPNTLMGPTAPGVVQSPERQSPSSPSERSILSVPDPCAAIRRELESIERIRDELQSQRNDLVNRVAELELELQSLKQDPSSPLGAFFASYEAKEMTPKMRKMVAERIQGFPVFLRPGEATWIAERLERKDWKEFADTSELAMIYFLGPARLVAELPPKRLSELRQAYAGQGVFNE